MTIPYHNLRAGDVLQLKAPIKESQISDSRYSAGGILAEHKRVFEQKTFIVARELREDWIVAGWVPIKVDWDSRGYYLVSGAYFTMDPTSTERRILDKIKYLDKRFTDRKGTAYASV